MPTDLSNLRKVVGASAMTVTALQTGTAVLALRADRRDYADGVWGPGLASVAVTSAAVGNGDPWRRWALAAATLGWAVRLEKVMLGRLRGKDQEDPRYTEFLEGASTPMVVGKVFVTQALAQLVVTAPLQLAAASTLPRNTRRWLFPAGVAVSVAGAALEAVADRQKAAFMAREDDDKPDVLDTGVWAWSRHPNYLGDSLFWDGTCISASASAGGPWTAPAPALMTWFLVFATGAKRTEKRMESRGAYRDYQGRVAFFFPRPPSHP